MRNLLIGNILRLWVFDRKNIFIHTDALAPRFTTQLVLLELNLNLATLMSPLKFHQTL